MPSTSYSTNRAKRGLDDEIAEQDKDECTAMETESSNGTTLPRKENADDNKKSKVDEKKGNGN